MLNRLSINLVLALVVAHKASALRKQLTLTTEELGGDSTEISANKPLIVHLDKNSMSPEAMETLARESNIDLADLPDYPQFVTSGEFESMKYSADDILEYLVRDQDLDLDTIKQDERYNQIEEILKEIADEYSEQDEGKRCSRGQDKDRGSWGRYPCGKPRGRCCDRDDDYDDGYWKIDDKESKYEDEDEEKSKWSGDDEDGKDEIDNRKSDGRDGKMGGKDGKLNEKSEKKLEDRFDDKFDEKLDEKKNDKLEEKLDDKLDDRSEEKLGDTKDIDDASEGSSDEKEENKKFFWSDENTDYYEDEDGTLTIQKPKYEETFLGTEISVGETQTQGFLAPTMSITYNSSNFSTYLTASSTVGNLTMTYTTLLNRTSTSQIRTTTRTSSSYVATSLYSSSSSTMRTETEHTTHKSSTRSAYSSSRISARSASASHKTTTTSSKPEQSTSEVEVSFNWKALSNVSNITMQRGIENTSNFLMPTSLLFASLLALLAVMQA